MYIKGNFRKYIFKSNQGYVIGLFKVRETSDDEKLVSYINKTITFTGNFIDLNEVDYYEFNGELINHDRYGEQFNVTSFNVSTPKSKDGLIEFLSSDLFKGIGEKKAEKIIEVLGNDVINVIIENKDSLLLVPGVTKKQAQTIYDGIIKYQNSYKIIISLNELGFNTRDALLIFKTYHEHSMDVISENIFNLIDDINDISFRKIDIIRQKLNISDNDLKRIKAGIKYVMDTINNETGDTYLLNKEIIYYTKRVLNVNDDIILEALQSLVDDREVIYISEKYFLKKMYNADINIVNRLLYLSGLKEPLKKEKNILQIVENGLNITFNDDQKEAIIKSALESFLIITGGPGVGKTTIIKAITEMYKEKNKLDYLGLTEELALLAPTGRASKRMSEQTLLPSSTIHRFLKWNKENNTFDINEDNKSKVKIVIIDEASMIDTYLFNSLLLGLERNTKIILVGDYDQLPSVGPGQVLKDLIESNAFCTIKLNQLYRQKEGSGIIDLAYAIKNNTSIENLFNKKDDLIFRECSSKNLQNILLEEMKNNEITNILKFQVLVPMYKGENGIDELNKFMQNIFNKKENSKEEISYDEVVFRENDKVLQLVNMPDENIYNGDIGIINEIKNGTKNEIYIDFDGILVKFNKSKFKDFKHAYAISIHKSQGSEFDFVIIPILNRYNRMLYKKLIYTAVTRTKKKLILIGEHDAFIKAIKNDLDNLRKSNLKNIIIASIK